MSRMRLCSTAKFSVLDVPDTLKKKQQQQQHAATTPAPPMRKAERPPKWNAAAPSSYVSAVLSETQESESEWVEVSTASDDACVPSQDAATPVQRRGEWEAYVDPETKHTYWYNAAEDRSTWELDEGEWQQVDAPPPSWAAQRRPADVTSSIEAKAGDSRAADDEASTAVPALVLEVNFLREVQQKLIKIVTAMHQRLTHGEDRDRDRDDRIRALGARVADLDRDLAALAATKIPAPPPKQSTLDAALAEAMRAEERRLFGS